MSFGDLMGKVLPFLGAAATGNVPALVAMAADKISEALGVKVEPTQEAVTTAFRSASPDQLMILKEKELEFQASMQAMGFANAKDMKHLELEETKAYISDTSDARHVHSQDSKVFWLGVAVLLTFALAVTAVLYGSLQVLSGGISVKDPSVVAAISGFIGTVVGYVAANAQQVVAYFFGSSKGSSDKNAALSAALKTK